MFACLFIPDFPVEAFVCLEPELRVQPVAVLEGKPPLSRIIAMNDRARDATLELGMTRMQAQLRAPEAVLRMRSPEQEATAHASLLDCGHAFSPRVEDTALDHIVMDVSGLDRSPRQSAASCRTNRAARHRSGITGKCRTCPQSRCCDLRRSRISRHYCDPRGCRNRASRHASDRKSFPST